MNVCRPGPKYFVFASNALHTVAPFFLGFFTSRQSNEQPPHAGSSGRPRCFLYQAWSFFVFFALKKIPPRPVTRCFFMPGMIAHVTPGRHGKNQTPKKVTYDLVG